jgi:acyl-CoA reductase-like NAD-dependent aldehyde dehydrogenase
VDVEKRFIPPTLILNPGLNSEIMLEELFCPILPIVEFESFDKVFDYIQEQP